MPSKSLFRRAFLIFIFLAPLAGPGAYPAGAASPAKADLDLVHLMARAGVQPIKPTAIPEFALKDIHGKRINFKEFTGKVVLLNFWATW
ncbi:MAG: hypothetical protein V3V62_12950 [bacterium]